MNNTRYPISHLRSTMLFIFYSTDGVDTHILCKHTQYAPCAKSCLLCYAEVVVPCDTLLWHVILITLLSLTTRKSATSTPSPLELAVDNHLNGVVSALCAALSDEALAHIGSVMEARQDGAPCLLWKAALSEDWSICDTLVKYKADVNCWHVGECGCLVTLLHKAITEEKESAGAYLIAQYVCLLCLMMFMHYRLKDISVKTHIHIRLH